MKKMWNEELENKVIVTSDKEIAKEFVKFLLEERGIKFYNSKTTVDSIFEKEGKFEVVIKKDRILFAKEEDKKYLKIVELINLVTLNEAREIKEMINKELNESMYGFLRGEIAIAVYNKRHSNQLKKELEHRRIVWNSGRSVTELWYDNEIPFAVQLTMSGKLVKANLDEMGESELERTIPWAKITDWEVGKK